MWLYFDKNGVLKTQIMESGNPSAGTTNFGIFAVFESTDTAANNANVSNATIKLVRPDRQSSDYPILIMQSDVQKEYLSTYPTDNTGHFTSGTTYTGYFFNFNDFGTDNDSTTDDEVIVLLDMPGLWKATITLIGQNRSLNVVGQATFSVNEGTTSQDEQTLSLDTLLTQIYTAIGQKLSIKSSTYMHVLAEMPTATLSSDLWAVGDVVYEKTTKAFYTVSSLTVSPYLTKINTKSDIAVKYLDTYPSTDLDSTLFAVNDVVYVKSTKSFYTVSNLTGPVLNKIELYNIQDGSGTGSIQMIQDGTSGVFSFTGKNPHATDLDQTLTGDIPYGATGQYATALGGKSAAKGKRSVAEGTTTIAQGAYSHAEGDNSVTLGSDSHAEGLQTVSYGAASHSEGRNTVAKGTNSHAEGNDSDAEGDSSHAEGYSTQAKGDYSHTEGSNTEVSQNCMSAHAEGGSNTASAVYTHAEGYGTQAGTVKDSSSSSGSGSAGGSASTPSTDIVGTDGYTAHAEGYFTNAYGPASHTEGAGTVASGARGHAEGFSTTASGENSHSEGNYTIASGSNSHSGGNNTKAQYNSQYVCGEYNDNKSDTLFEVGNGISDSARSNAFEVYRDGTARVGAMGTDNLSVATRQYVDNHTPDAYIKSVSVSGDTLTFIKKDNTTVTYTPTIPTVNNKTITITQGGVVKGTFTLNQGTDQTIALDAGGGGGTYTAGNGIDITNNVISADFDNVDNSKAVANKQYVIDGDQEVTDKVNEEVDRAEAAEEELEEKIEKKPKTYLIYTNATVPTESTFSSGLYCKEDGTTLSTWAEFVSYLGFTPTTNQCFNSALNSTNDRIELVYQSYGYLLTGTGPFVPTDTSKLNQGDILYIKNLNNIPERIIDAISPAFAAALKAKPVLTSAQQNAIDSGITAAKVATYDGYGDGTTPVGKSAGYTQDGEIYEALVSLQGNIDAKQDTISDLSTIRSNAAQGATAYANLGGYKLASLSSIPATGPEENTVYIDL